jgi:hypothetical protein
MYKYIQALPYNYSSVRKRVLMQTVRKFNCVLLNSSPKECFHRRSKVEGQHPRTQRPHTSCVGARGRIFLLFLLARIGIEAISKPGKQLIVEVHASGVKMLSELPDHHDSIAREMQYA